MIRSITIFLFAAILLHGAALPHNAEGLEKVRLQLKWKHQFQFAGYYAAKLKGYYRDAGLDVTFLEAKRALDPVRQVLDGKAEFGVGNSELLLERAKGKPIVVLGVVFQHSPHGLVVLNESNITNLHQCVSKPMMIEPRAAEIFAYLKREGVKSANLNLLPHSLSTKDLLDGSVASMSMYVSVEPFDLEAAGKPYTMFMPSTAGIDFYGDNFFTTEKEIETHPHRVRAFYDATVRGWEYALKHPDEIIEYIIEHYPEHNSREHLHFEAERMQDLIRADLVKPGFMYKGRWEHIVATYKELGMLVKDVDLDAFMYAPKRKYEYGVILIWFLGGVLLVAVVALVGSYILYLYHKLHASHDHLESVVNNAPIALITIAANREVVSWNEEAAKIFGWGLEEVLGRDIFELIVPDSERLAMQKALNDVRESQIQSFAEIRNCTKNCDVITCEWVNVPYGLQHGYIICMVQDVTQRKAMEANLHEINAKLEERVEFESRKRIENERMLLAQNRLASMGEMIANIAHQWRQPLAHLNLLFFAIERKFENRELDAEVLKEKLDEAESITQYMSDTINDFSNFFKPDKKMEPFSVKEGIEKCVRMMQGVFEENNIEVRVNVVVDSRIEGYYGEYLQVLLALLSNAKDVLMHKPTGARHIDIRLEQNAQGRSQLQIEDNGGGIAQEHLAKIFDPYFTANKGPKSTGLGLYMSKMIIEENMNGTIGAENTKRGARFTVTV